MAEVMAGAGDVMATYVYRCPEHDEFEHQQPMTASLPDLRKCPKCGRKSPRVFRAPNFIGGPTTGAQRE